MRSTDSGASFQSANSGIPANCRVRDLEIDSSGIIATATTYGLFTSTNNGDLWEQATGIPASDTTVTLIFDYPLTTEDGDDPRLYIGSQNGSIYQSFKNNLYLTATLLTNPADGEVASITVPYLQQENKKVHGVAVFPKNGDAGGVYVTNDTGAGFVKENDGLPANPKVSALSGKVVQSRVREEVEMYAGLCENTSDGAKIYKRTFVVSVEQISSVIPINYALEQNYPIPFNPSTTIEFSISEQSFVKVEIFNSLGEKASTLVYEELNAGTYKYEWNASNLPIGIYYYKLLANTFSQTRELVLLK